MWYSQLLLQLLVEEHGFFDLCIPGTPDVLHFSQETLDVLQVSRNVGLLSCLSLVGDETATLWFMFRVAFPQAHLWYTETCQTPLYENELWFYYGKIVIFKMWVTKDYGMAKKNNRFSELGGLLPNCNPLLNPKYMTNIVVSHVIHYLAHFRFRLLWPNSSITLI